jgi:triphosphoribosyl-dephospho-CoA synthase
MHATAFKPALKSQWILQPEARGGIDTHTRRELRRCASEIGRLAVACLYEELALYPKPGLVSPFDNGSHDDMDAGTFMRSMFALRHYFIAIAQAGAGSASFDTLKSLGIEAEKRMLAATRGINTHRGAIFSLGMLCAAAGYCCARKMTCTPETLRAVLLIQWGEALELHASLASAPRMTQTQSHGQIAAAEHHASGAREEVALGMPSLFDVALPALRQSLNAGRPADHAQVDALFALMAHISDTNVFYRGGREGALIVRNAATQFIEHGGTGNPEWREYAMQCHRLFIHHRISPGGAADLLAATCFVHKASRWFSAAW